MPVVRSGDADIAYEVTGEGDPILLVMGLGADMKGWTAQTPVFAEHHRVITFDNRGAGLSSTPPGPYTTEQMARDALAVLDATGVERTHVVAVSLGGAIAQHIALMAPDRVRSLVLAVTWAGPSRWRSRLRAMQLTLAERGREELVRARMLFIYRREWFEEKAHLIELIEKYMLDEGASDEGYLAQLEAAESHDVRDRLGTVTVPTVVVAAREDILVPPGLTREVASLIPGAELVEMDAGHALVFERADEFNRLVLDFVARNPIG